ncbi:MAG: rod shape-determining protein RodA [Myxococcales bacterium]|nr:rod shape-determining protein RodA [Myxococcales bacterium]
MRLGRGIGGQTFGGGRLRDHIDWPLFIVVTLIAVLGVINLYSATSVYFGTSRSYLAELYINQIYWLAIGGVAGGIVAAIDYRHIERFGYVIYTVGIFSLILVTVLGSGIRGASRWLDIGPFRFQPSEFTKICLIIVLGKFLHDDPKNEERTLKDLIIPAILTGVPALLVAKQPDLGTALVHVLIFLAVAAITRVRRKSMAMALGSMAVAIPIVWQFTLPYQRARVTAFLNPGEDLSGAGYHAYHARIAIGNGGLFGQGYMQGMQNQYWFLPDQYSDFPFPVFAEEWGFVGTLVLLSLYGFLVVWSIRIASQARDRFGAVVAVGCGAMLFWHTIINLGMASGMLPVVGMTLPLFSYGGSSVVSMLLAVALLMNVSMRRHAGFSALGRL